MSANSTEIQELLDANDQVDESFEGMIENGYELPEEFNTDFELPEIYDDSADIEEYEYDEVEPYDVNDDDCEDSDVNDEELSYHETSDIGDNYEQDEFGGITGIYTEGKAQMPQNQWNIPSHNAAIYGTNLIKELIGNRFTFPKSLYAVRDSLSHVIKSNKEAIIVDFFAGSGTTLHAVNLLNAEDNGNRKCIMVTNNEVSEEEENELKELGYKPGDDEWEKLGIAKYVTWPRTYCSINGVDINGNPLKGDYGVEVEDYIEDTDSVVISKSTGNPTRKKLYQKKKTQLYPKLSEIKKSNGFNSNVKYFKCDWIPRKPEDYLLSNALLLHIKEMIELEHFIEIDNEKYVVILNKDDFRDYILNDKIYTKIEKLWVNQNIIFTSEELKLLKNKGFNYIPREYFGHELKDVAE